MSMFPLDHTTLVDAVEHNGNRLLEAAGYDPEAEVEACPGWDVARLLVHMGQVHDFITGLAEAGSAERPDRPGAKPPEGADAAALIEWERGLLDRLVTALRSGDPDAPAWTWGSEKNLGWLGRRMAHETIVHRWDVEQAVGAPTEIDGDLAADGVDEVIHVGLQTSTNPKQEYTYPDGSIHLHRTDGEGEWLLVPGEGGLTVTREHAKGDVAVRAQAVDLLLYLWGRSMKNLDIFGDVALAEAWHRAAP